MEDGLNLVLGEDGNSVLDGDRNVVLDGNWSRVQTREDTGGEDMCVSMQCPCRRVHRHAWHHPSGTGGPIPVVHKHVSWTSTE